MTESTNGSEEREPSRPAGKKPSFWRAFVPAALLVIALWYGWGWLLLPSWGLDRGQLGQVGDSFGGINALFAGLALAGVIATLWNPH